MKINSAEYLRSIDKEEDILDEQLPQFAFIGRSNVGKSSFLNTITGIKNLCRTGSRPGLTQKVNLFLVNKKLFFADLPGYGYAKASKKQKEFLEHLIFWYLSHQSNKFKQIFLLIDSRVGATALDLDVIEFLKKEQLPYTIIASKIDQIKNSQLHKALNEIKTSTLTNQVIPFSSLKKIGIKEVLNLIE